MQSPYAEPFSLLMAGDVADDGLPDDCGPLAHTCTSAVLSLGYHGYIKNRTDSGENPKTKKKNRKTVRNPSPRDARPLSHVAKKRVSSCTSVLSKCTTTVIFYTRTRRNIFVGFFFKKKYNTIIVMCRPREVRAAGGLSRSRAKITWGRRRRVVLLRTVRVGGGGGGGKKINNNNNNNNDSRR